MATQKRPLPSKEKARRALDRTIDNIFSEDYVEDAFENFPYPGDIETKAGAQEKADAAQVYAIQRANHTGTQSVTTIKESIIDRSTLTRRWLDLYTAPQKMTTLEYISSTEMYLWQPISSIDWLRISLELKSTGVFVINRGQAWSAIHGVNDDDASIAYIGAWAQAAATTALGGTHTKSPGDSGSMSFDVTGTEELYIVMSTRSTAGYATVTIDGSDLLLDKSEMVYVAGQWVFDSYSPVTANNKRIRIAAGLNHTKTYTIDIVMTNSRNPASSGDRLFFEGYGTPVTRIDNVGSVTNSNNYLDIETIAFGAGMAVSYTPDGATSAELFGDANHENTSAINIKFGDNYLDDIQLNATNNLYTSELIRLKQTYYIRHSETGAINNGECSRVTTFSSAGVLDNLNIEWLVGGLVKYGYFGMLAVSGAYSNRGYVASDTVSYDLSIDNDILHGQLPESVAMIWSTNHNFIMFSDTDKASQDWMLSDTTKNHIEDKSTGENKIYPKSHDNRTINPGDIWLNGWTVGIRSIRDPETFVPSL